MKKRRKISDQLKEYEESLLKRGESYQGESLAELDESEDFGEDDDDFQGHPHFWLEQPEKELSGDLNQRKRERPDKDEEALLVWKLYKELGAFNKVAWKLNIPPTTVKSKFARAFAIKTGKPFTGENHRVFKQLQEMAKAAEVSPCLDCSDRHGAKCPCEKLLKLLPDEHPQRGYIGNSEEGDAREWRSDLEIPEGGPWGVKSARKPTAE